MTIPAKNPNGNASVIESVLARGDLSKLTPETAH
jgi:hypothetical protein